MKRTGLTHCTVYGNTVVVRRLLLMLMKKAYAKCKVEDEKCGKEQA